MCRYRSPVSVWPGAGTAPDRGKPLACGICHAPCLLPVLPVTGDGGAFLRVRCRRYRHSQVSDNARTILWHSSINAISLCPVLVESWGCEANVCSGIVSLS